MEDTFLSEDLAALITQSMKLKGLTIRDLARLLATSYEHSRRIVRGYPAAGPVRKLLCDVLDLDFERLEALTVAAQMRRKFGDASVRVIGQNPELEPIEKAWIHLTSDQNQDAISLIRGWAERSKRRNDGQS